MSQRNERSQQPELSGVTHWLIHHARTARRTPCPPSLKKSARGLRVSILRAGRDYASRRAAVGEPDDRSWKFARNACGNQCFRSQADVIHAQRRNFSYFSLRSPPYLMAGLHAALF